MKPLRVLFVVLLLLPSTPALADNCGGFFDCFGTLQLAMSVAFGLGSLIILLDFMPYIITGVTLARLGTLLRGSGIIPGESIDMSTREGAYVGTAKFKEGTVGYGVHQSIGGIQTVLGSFGEARIGDLFNRPDVQELLAKENTVENNKKVAELEYEYWQQVLNDNSGTAESRVGGVLGIMFNPTDRTILQMGIGGAVSSWDYTVYQYIDPAILQIRDGVEKIRTMAQYRIDLLNHFFLKRP